MSTVDSPPARPLRLGCFDVTKGFVFAADESLPVAMEIDAASGEIVQVFSWPLSGDHVGQPTALDILGRDESVLIASPAAGGIVEIDRRSGRATIIPLDAGAGTLLGDEDAIWAVARPDWDEQRRARRPEGRRPVVREEPTEEEVARDQEMMRHLGFHGADPVDQEAARTSLAEWRDAEGDFEELSPSTPIWLVHAGTARRIDAGLEQPILAAAGGKLAGVCRLPSDPIVKHLTPYGSVSWRYPGTVVMIDDAGTLDVLGPIPGSGGAAVPDDGSVWLLGFEGEAYDEPAPEVREVLVAEGRVGEALGVRPRRPVAVVDRFIVDLVELEAADGSAADRDEGSAVVQFLPADGGEPWIAGPADVSHRSDSVLARASGGEVWLANHCGSTLLVAAPGRAGVRKLRISLDCRPWMPRPALPAGFDPDQFEQSQLGGLRGAFLEGWLTSEGGTRPFIDGVTFDVVELRGEFPDRDVVALFHAEDRPGTQFGRRWRLYDELGNPVDHKYADIHLMEDVESGDGGLPPADRCVPDDAGVTWFEWWDNPE